MIDYSIAAIPTEYRGRTYRSRLEARWAAFFDRLGLAHEYEPFDLGGWSPDFLLTEINALVEVKPLTEFDADVWAKIVGACREQSIEQAVIMTMLAPQLERIAYIGWMALPWHDQSMTAVRAGVGWYANVDTPSFIADIVCIVPGKFMSAGGEVLELKEFGLANHDVPLSYSDYTMEQWARATSDVQWKP